MVATRVQSAAGQSDFGGQSYIACGVDLLCNSLLAGHRIFVGSSQLRV